MSEQGTQPIEQIRQEKIRKLDEIRELGFTPYPPEPIFKIQDIHSVRQRRPKQEVAVAGRVLAIRPHGGITFADLRDQTDKLQLSFREENLGEKKLRLLGLVDPADFIEAKGALYSTKTKELTLEVTEFNLLSKAIRPLPDLHQGLKDKEIRYRKRHLDLIANQKTSEIFAIRHKLTQGIRDFLNQKGLTEVETPILQPLYGGANAKPFTTHISALDAKAYLRIAPELYLKRLVVGGIEGVYELAKHFRNEGIDQTHFPEFTMLEAYIPYADYHKMMNLMEEMARHLSFKVLQRKEITVGEQTINLKQDWRRISITDLITQHLGIKPLTMSREELYQYGVEHSLEVEEDTSRGELIFIIFDKLITPKLTGPIWTIDYPIEVSPLAKKHRDKKGFAERFELYIGGVELFDGWSEINDPIEQRERFEAENYRKFEEGELAQPIDEDFLEALEHGMPPLAGVGFGIERLTMFFTNTWQIQETILFPFKKPSGLGERSL